MKTNELELAFVQYIPYDLLEGILYISFEFSTAIHLCACGCRMKTVTAFKPMWENRWTYVLANGEITIRPSILNPCGAHYYITQNKVEQV